MKKRIVLTLVAAVAAILLMGCGITTSSTYTQTTTDANGNTTTTTTTTTNGETTTETTESSSEQETSSVAGTYSHTYTEEMDGSELEFTETVVLKDDGTCEVTFQDTIPGTWAEDKITLDDGSSFEFSVEDNTLSLNRDGEWISFNK